MGGLCTRRGTEGAGQARGRLAIRRKPTWLLCLENCLGRRRASFMQVVNKENSSDDANDIRKEMRLRHESVSEGEGLIFFLAKTRTRNRRNKR